MIQLVDHSARALLSEAAQQTSVRIARALAARASAAVELRGLPADLPWLSPPPGARMLLTHAADPDPAWGRHGYLSAVRRLRPTWVWALDGGRPPATAIGTSAASTATSPALTVADATTGDVPAATDWSIAGWVRFDGGLAGQPDPYPNIASRLFPAGPSPPPACGWTVIVHAAAVSRGSIEVQIADSAGYILRPSANSVGGGPGTFPDAATWQHVAVTVDSVAARVWLGGALVGSTPMGAARYARSPSCPTGILHLGWAYAAGAAVVGDLDDWAMWIGRALTAGEVADLWRARTGLSGLDWRALLADSRPRAHVTFDFGSRLPAIGGRELPAGRAAPLPTRDLALPDVGERAASTPYTWSAFLRLVLMPSGDYDLRLPAAGDRRPGTAGRPRGAAADAGPGAARRGGAGRLHALHVVRLPAPGPDAVRGLRPPAAGRRRARPGLDGVAGARPAPGRRAGHVRRRRPAVRRGPDRGARLHLRDHDH